jgi:PhnB protein
MSFHPYLFFGGDCREAFTHYQSVFGGELQLISMQDMPGDDPVPAHQAHLIAHASLTDGDDLLMGSDDPSGGHESVQGMQVNYDVADVGEAQRAFAALAAGGEVTLAMAETSWSPAFGMCRDRFGTPWMVSAAAP